ncbi:MAG: PIN domain-containing protein [Haloferacaceae archaeon]
MILDSTYLGDLVAADSDAVALSKRIDTSGEPVRVPAAVVWELFYGLGKLGETERATTLRRKYAAVLGGTVPTDLTDGVARRAGTLRGKHAASDRLADLDGADSVVAAHGLALGEPVVSNDEDLQDVEGLDVVTY